MRAVFQRIAMKRKKAGLAPFVQTADLTLGKTYGAAW
jgi:hypothetical protein